MPTRDKGILANVVSLIYPLVDTKRRAFRNIDELERGITEVGFDDNSEPMAFGIPTTPT